MREYVVIAVVCALAAIALLRPRIGLYGYIWFALMRPDYLAWAAGHFPFSPVLALATLAGSLRYFDRFPRVFQHPLSRTLVLYQIPVIASVFLAIDPHLSYGPFWDFEHVVVMSLLIPVLVDSEERLRELLLVVALSIGLLGLKFAIFGWSAGGAFFAQGYGASLDNNALALAMVIAVPICWNIRAQYESRLLKGSLTVMVFACVATVVMTRSRGASLALATTFVLMLMRSRRKVGLAIVLALLALPSIYLVREQYLVRMSTLADPTADASASSRYILAASAFRMWRDYPITGVGFGNDNGIALQHSYIADRIYADLKVHNTYLQVLLDSGIFALLIFVYLLFGAIIRLYYSVKICRSERSGLELYPAAIQIPLIAIAQYGLTGGRERYDCLYFLLMTAAAWLLIQRQSRTSKAITAAEPVLAEA